MELDEVNKVAFDLVEGINTPLLPAVHLELVGGQHEQQVTRLAAPEVHLSHLVALSANGVDNFVGSRGLHLLGDLVAVYEHLEVLGTARYGDVAIRQLYN